MAVIVGLVALSSAGTLLGLEAISNVVQYLALGPDYRAQMLLWVGVIALSGVAVWLIEFVRMMLLMRLGMRVMQDIRMTIFRHLQELSGPSRNWPRPSSSSAAAAGASSCARRCSSSCSSRRCP